MSKPSFSFLNLETLRHYLTMEINVKLISLSSGGSRISRWGGVDPLGGANLQRIHFSAKTCAKTKEIDPVGGGGGGAGGAPLDPPMSL